MCTFTDCYSIIKIVIYVQTFVLRVNQSIVYFLSMPQGGMEQSSGCVARRSEVKEGRCRS